MHGNEPAEQFTAGLSRYLQERGEKHALEDPPPIFLPIFPETVAGKEKKKAKSTGNQEKWVLSIAWAGNTQELGTWTQAQSCGKLVYTLPGVSFMTTLLGNGV